MRLTDFAIPDIAFGGFAAAQYLLLAVGIIAMPNLAAITLPPGSSNQSPDLKQAPAPSRDAPFGRGDVVIPVRMPEWGRPLFILSMCFSGPTRC